MNNILIDGQQRLTTMTILFRALYEYIPDGMVELDGDAYAELTGHNTETSDYEKIIKTEDSVKYYVNYKTLCRNLFSINSKSRITRARNIGDLYVELIESNGVYEGDMRRLSVQCYNYFKEKIEEEMDSFDTEEDKTKAVRKIFETAVSKITVVTINIEDSEDPSIVFNSLNTTGLKLTPVAMFRNHVMMSCAGLKGNKQEAIYDDIWVPFKQKFKDESQMAEFLRVYLMMECERPINKNDLFGVLKKYYDKIVGTEKSTIETNIKVFFANLTHSLINYDYVVGARPYPQDNSVSASQINQSIELINITNFKSHRCYALKILNHVNSKKQLAEMFSYIESYVVRRTMVQGLLNNTVDKMFINLCKEKVFDPSKLKSVLIHEEFPGHWPQNDELRRSLVEKDFYSSSKVSFCINVFERLDLKMRGEKVKVQEGQLRSIEHIVPETESDEWKQYLGTEKYEEMFANRHKLGNLTLLSLPKNSSIGQWPYEKKYQEAYKNSPYMITSKLITSRKNWNVDKYNKHRDALIQKIIELWTVPSDDIKKNRFE